MQQQYYKKRFEIKPLLSALQAIFKKVFNIINFTMVIYKY